MSKNELVRPYNTSEIKSKYKKLISSATKCINNTGKILDEIKKYLRINKNKFIAYSNRDIKGVEKVDPFYSFNKLVCMEYELISCREKSDNCQNFLQVFYADIYENMKKLSAASNGLTWAFSSKNRKSASIDAAGYFAGLDKIVSELHITEDIDFLMSFSNPSSDIIKADFENRRDRYCFEIYKTISESNIDRSELFDTNRIWNQRNEINKCAGTINSLTDKSKNEVKSAVEKMVVSKLLELLKSISVDELNRNKKGIRTKALLDAGYSNIADIYTASEASLASIYGISYDKAYTIKDTASGIANEAKKKIKIQLSVDDKNKTASGVVSALYKTIYFKEVNNSVIALLGENDPIISEEIETVQRHNNALTWPFEPSDVQSQVINSYDSLKRRLTGEYYLNVSDSLSRLQQFQKDEKTAWDSFEHNSIAFYNALEDICPGVLGNDNSLYGLPEDLARQIQDECIYPDGLLCTLRRYQEWGVKYILHQGRVLLGDEMGLGKTIQAIAAMVSLKNTGATHFVVVCPASVLTNWCREIAKHSKLKPILVHGNDKSRAFASWVKYGGVAVTNYESAGCFKFSDGFRFSQIVVDEAHYIKNPSARRTRNVLRICGSADRVLFMTGTPLENNVDEMVGLIKTLNPSIAAKIESIKFLVTASQFRNEISPVYYRRKREDVLTELPELVESNEWCEMLREEENEYENLLLEGAHYMTIRQLSWNCDDLRKSCKALRMLEIINEAKSNGRKILIFSFFLNTIRKIKALLGESCLNPITGELNSNRRQEIIDEFEQSDPGTSLVCQIMSGGTGLNIQAASVVIICEPQLKPSIENQAISRAYRMGQSRSVLVYRLLCENTLDEKINNLLEGKQLIFDTFADKSVAAEIEKKETEIDTSKLKDLIAEEIDRIKGKKTSSNDSSFEGKEDLDKKYTEKNFSDESDEKDDFSAETNDVDSEKDYHADYQTDFRKKTNTEKYEKYETDYSSIKTVPADEPLYYSGKDHYSKLLNGSYDDAVAVLLTKYGKAYGDYFLSDSCISKNKRIVRSSEGLYIHHIDEDKAIKLSDSKLAVKYPFSYQKADRLVYCNLLEHFILHVKIAETFRLTESNELLGMGGVNYISRQINDFYDGYKSQTLIRATKLIANDFDSYIEALRYIYGKVSSHPVFSKWYSKDDFSLGWDGRVIKFIRDRL